MQSLDRKTDTKTAYKYTEKTVSMLLKGLSSERLNRYAKLAPKSNLQQLQLYIWNTALSESLYTPIQGLEIVTRNYFYNGLIEYFGEQWYNHSKLQFSYSQEQSLNHAKETLKREGKLITSGNLISTLSFGFWVGLLGSKYETSLWRSCLYKTFTNKQTPFLRKYVHYEFDLIRILRNRIAHHEPILRADLHHHYIRIIKMIGWFCKETADWIDGQSRFYSVWKMPINPFL